MSNKAGKVEVLKGRSGFHEPARKMNKDSYDSSYVKMFGETCYHCRKNTKQKNEDGNYVCPTCNRVIKSNSGGAENIKSKD